MPFVISFVCGLLMSLGLALSGMIHPQKVIAFLDLFGDFDPTLGFVMLGALSVVTLGLQLLKRKSKPLFAESFARCDRLNVDKKLIGGSVLFGIGWGLAGLCPAPAIVDLGLSFQKVMPFFLAMLVGMWLGKKIK